MSLLSKETGQTGNLFKWFSPLFYGGEMGINVCLSTPEVS